ncbi:unnamed protein product [Schistosoma curassoni]|uniref:Uncharacterized protein n=1 Tax=Schistosoma curassoni TaxID=6186 RepID=A0A183KHQ7_9TREM|nr:unnamed protein product [Schistosoma curassoni]
MSYHAEQAKSDDELGECILSTLNSRVSELSAWGSCDHLSNAKRTHINKP